MASSEHPSFRGAAGNPPPRPIVEEETICTDRVQIERKTFVFTLKDNPRGRFLRITEDVGGRRDSIIIPAPGLEEFKHVLDAMVKTAASQPAPHQP